LAEWRAKHERKPATVTSHKLTPKLLAYKPPVPKFMKRRR
jgi:hypothetical protein